MSDLIWLSEAQLRRIISGIIFVIRNGLRSRLASDTSRLPNLAFHL